MLLSGQHENDLSDAFVNVTFSDRDECGPAGGDKGSDTKEFASWMHNSTARHHQPVLFFANLLRKAYPKHSLVMSQDYRLNILGFPGAVSMPLKPDELITNINFYPIVRTPGLLLDGVEYGCFRTAWETYEFTVYIVKWREGYFIMNQNFILFDGPEAPARALLHAVGSWATELNEEIWVFENGFWSKNHKLWTEVQKANWDDVILKQSFKDTVRKDVTSFFDSEEMYKKLAIPWKRGIIMYGPPGNGKTISLKAVMKDVGARGYSPLYVKSFVSWRGEEGSMAEVFGWARQMAPCVIILEDLDSLINDRNRSFFLNQLDGIEGNEGLLIIGTTNHFDRLDPGLSERPSRFDRKYEFKDPDHDERELYARYWQKKLEDNKDIDFPDSLVTEVADSTNGFSFAYLKEAFVSSLVIFVSDDNKDDFPTILKTSIKTLKKQIDTSASTRWFSSERRGIAGNNTTGGMAPLPPKPDQNELLRQASLQTVSEFGPARIFML